MVHVKSIKSFFTLVSKYRDAALEKIKKLTIKEMRCNNYFKLRILLFIVNFFPGNVKLKLASLRDLKIIHKRKINILFNQYKQKNYGKKDLSGYQDYAEVLLPELGYYLLYDVVVHPDSPILYKNKKALFQSYPDGGGFANIDYVSGFIWGNNRNRILVNRKYNQVFDEGILLFGSFSKNWYHWTIEILSRVELLDLIPSKYKDYPLLIPERCFLSRNHIDFFKLVFQTDNVKPVSNNSALVKSCIYIDSPAISIPKFINKDHEIDLMKVGNKRTDILFNYRNRVLANLEIQNKSEGQKTRYPKKLFLARKQDKREYNQDEILSYVKSIGFVDVFLEELDIYQQLNFMKNAEIIIGPTGAAWANLLFSNAKFALIWLPDFVGESNTYSNIAAITGTDLRHLRFKTKENSWNEFKSSDEKYMIDLNYIREALLLFDRRFSFNK